MSKISKKEDIIRISIPVPEDLYLTIKTMAKADLRSIAQEARLLIEMGVEGMKAASAIPEEQEEPVEAIGFKVEPSDEDEEDAEEEEDRGRKSSPKKKSSR